MSTLSDFDLQASRAFVSLSDFDSQAYEASKAVIGVSALTIGTGDPVEVVDGEARHNRDSELSGYEDSNSLTIVASRIDFQAEYIGSLISYIGKICTVDGTEWRISDLIQDVNYITLDLVGVNQVS